MDTYKSQFIKHYFLLIINFGMLVLWIFFIVGSDQMWAKLIYGWLIYRTLTAIYKNFKNISAVKKAKKFHEQWEENERKRRSAEQQYKRNYGENAYNRVWEEFKKQQTQQQQNKRIWEEYQRARQNSTINRRNGMSTDQAFKLFKLNKESTEIDIKKRFRLLAKTWHPDKFTNDTDDNKKIAERNFQKVNNAYELIKKYKNMA